MAVGFPTKANWAAGDILTAAQMDDLAGTLNTVQSPLGNAAGKNKIINGDFGVWQRGTSFSVASTTAYTADRWFITSFSDTVTVSRQTFTPGTAPVAGYEGSYFLQMVNGSTTVGYPTIEQRIEDVRTYAGQTVTLSFWAKANVAVTGTASMGQNFGSGGSGSVSVGSTSIALTTSWQRFTYTVAVPSITGKTIGTNSYFQVQPFYFSPSAAANTIQIWGVQLEAGSTATNFQSATGTVQGELAACQRYYWQSEATSQYFGGGTVTSGQSYWATCKLPVTMRVAPTVTITSTDNGNFPSTAGTAIRITTNSFVEQRNANGTTTSGYFGSSVIATSEL